jgi:hypothetical protein
MERALCKISQVIQCFLDFLSLNKDFENVRHAGTRTHRGSGKISNCFGYFIPKVRTQEFFYYTEGPYALFLFSVLKEKSNNPLNLGSLIAVSPASLRFEETDRFQMNRDGSCLLSTLAGNK